jgi:uncharacterized protein YbjT (DUF2867 family)
MVLVTGATGKVGRNVVSGLIERGMEVAALVRDPDRADLPAGLAVLQGDLPRPDELAQHLDRVDDVFLVWPFLTPDGADELVSTLEARTRRIVYLSAEAAGRRPESFWALVERSIERSAAEWVFLRPTGFAANTLMWADQIRRGDVVRWVYGQAARSLIDERDIADVAVLALTHDRHVGARHILTGPATVTQTEQVHAIGEALGRNLRWEEIPREHVHDQLGGIPDTALDTWASFATTPEVVTSTVRELTGRPPRSFAEWANRHADDFR